jgi:hypothetical protein
MKRFSLMVASAAIGFALLAGVTHELTAEVTAAIPPGGGCYYYLYTCSYDNGSYWSDCTPGLPPGMIPTASAKMLCGTFNQS